jgi:hypothetical protein
LDILAQITDGSATSHRHASGIRDDVAGYDFEKGGLARAIASDDGNAIAHADGEANPAEELMIVI